jgi:hypothetical protein
MVSIFRNPNLLTNIHYVDEPLHLETNGGGSQQTYQVGTVANFREAWYNPDSIANILSLSQVRMVRRVTMDTQAEAAYHVHKSNGRSTVFAEHISGRPRCCFPERQVHRGTSERPLRQFPSRTPPG